MKSADQHSFARAGTTRGVFTRSGKLGGFLITERSVATGCVRNQLGQPADTKLPSGADFDRHDRHVERDAERDDLAIEYQRALARLRQPPRADIHEQPAQRQAERGAAAEDRARGGAEHGVETLGGCEGELPGHGVTANLDTPRGARLRAG